MELKTLRFICKRGNLESAKKDIKKYGESRQVIITKNIKLTKAQFNHFTDNLFAEYDFLKDSCEYIEDFNAYTAVSVTDGAHKVVVETQGYNYPRYISIVK
ncbi:hypothetical protein IX317_000469 [Fusobacterium sp. DD29]|uniref:hypothetical protein n=1 Tax=unclassified Fusobacterium TaxID=2648384 RepID=UPI001B8D811A|nr:MULTISPECIES: hypothetical protein [unclassified Fusobacterium]MBR8700219.1 hypothetical protein [Fusobacterium sp. DD45]MBR8710330.1 hypothetical protein [Fusobacterium sp. DD28]MBR8748808.1 hypothetical protein [Fusobacterium sp. DD29]MBR8750941.1 hypothetical protein [Fusobacterium sp. DD26]MBR8761035.1 hypothetical protein [Fusobacterium sp. DD25]